MFYNDVTNCNIKIEIFLQDWSYNNEEKNKSDQYSGKTRYVQSIAKANRR